jgi:hypothetical protein
MPGAHAEESNMSTLNKEKLQGMIETMPDEMIDIIYNTIPLLEENFSLKNITGRRGSPAGI